MIASSSCSGGGSAAPAAAARAPKNAAGRSFIAVGKGALGLAPQKRMLYGRCRDAPARSGLTGPDFLACLAFVIIFSAWTSSRARRSPWALAGTIYNGFLLRARARRTWPRAASSGQTRAPHWRNRTPGTRPQLPRGCTAGDGDGGGSWGWLRVALGPRLRFPAPYFSWCGEAVGRSRRYRVEDLCDVVGPRQ